jgi:hypothetical protein
MGKKFLAALLLAGASFACPTSAADPVDPAKNGAAYSAIEARVLKGERVTLYVGFTAGSPEPGTALATLPSWAGVDTTEPMGVFRCYRDKDTGKARFERFVTAYIPPVTVYQPAACKT